MVFPAQRNLQDYWSMMKGAAATVKQRAEFMSGLAATSGANATLIKDFAALLTQQKALIQSCVVPGIVPFAQTQLNDNLIDITAEFNTMVTAIQSAIDWIVTNLPKDGNGFLLVEQFPGGGSGVVTPRNFTVGDLTTFKTVCDSLSATIRVV